MQNETLSETPVTTVLILSTQILLKDVIGHSRITFFSGTHNNGKLKSKHASHPRVHKEGQ